MDEWVDERSTQVRRESGVFWFRVGGRVCVVPVLYVCLCVCVCVCQEVDWKPEYEDDKDRVRCDGAGRRRGVRTAHGWMDRLIVCTQARQGERNQPSFI